MLNKLQSARIFTPLGRLFQAFRQQALRQRSTRALPLLFSVGLGLSLIVSACSSGAPTSSTASPAGSPSSPAAGSVVHIGYQKAATILSVLKSQGTLDKALAASGSSVE